jgi:hypothetical protein
MVIITLAVTIYLIYIGYTYYNTSIEERFYHPQHTWFKPSGIYGQGLGIIGTSMILFGVVIYILRKRYDFLSKYVRLKYLLEFHIFLCTLGPILVLFHTTFKFGGIVSVAFWSMVAVVLSGVAGRFIYIQIPRTIAGRELTLNEVKEMKTDLANVLNKKYKLNSDTIQLFVSFTMEDKETKTKITTQKLRKTLIKEDLTKQDIGSIIKMVKNEKTLSGKIARLETMQKLFKYWHVAHLPFALIMLVIVVIHIAITVTLGYKWIF